MSCNKLVGRCLLRYASLGWRDDLPPNPTRCRHPIWLGLLPKPFNYAVNWIAKFVYTPSSFNLAFFLSFLHRIPVIPARKWGENGLSLICFARDDGTSRERHNKLFLSGGIPASVILHLLSILVWQVLLRFWKRGAENRHQLTTSRRRAMSRRLFGILSGFYILGDCVTCQGRDVLGSLDMQMIPRGRRC